LIIHMIELDHQKSAAKALVNKVRLNTVYLCNLTIHYCWFA